ncbi:GntR family transcriptional regulator [Leifsonia sp. NPDC056665]|uniref:GntR family transcriptional regulator n=1 Tax=Leifsonia sp. NPDC056665 TaxID=3345901 RepID=UPI00369FD397
MARDRAYNAVKKAILTRAILPGERLDDEKLQAWLRMSKTPIRQALQTLTLEGLVETAAHSYTRVVEPRAEDAVLNLQTIGVFVLGILDLTIASLSEDQRAELLQDLDRLIAALNNRDIEGSIAASQNYYAHLIALCPNHVLVELSERTLAARAYFVVVAYRALGIEWGEAERAYRQLREALALDDREAVSDATAIVFRIDVPQGRKADA